MFDQVYIYAFCARTSNPAHQDVLRQKRDVVAQDAAPSAARAGTKTSKPAPSSPSFATRDGATRRDTAVSLGNKVGKWPLVSVVDNDIQLRF